MLLFVLGGACYRSSRRRASIPPFPIPIDLESPAAQQGLSWSPPLPVEGGRICPAALAFVGSFLVKKRKKESHSEKPALRGGLLGQKPLLLRLCPSGALDGDVLLAPGLVAPTALLHPPCSRPHPSQAYQLCQLQRPQQEPQEAPGGNRQHR